jgi:hypothetical protein
VSLHTVVPPIPEPPLQPLSLSRVFIDQANESMLQSWLPDQVNDDSGSSPASQRTHDDSSRPKEKDGHNISDVSKAEPAKIMVITRNRKRHSKHRSHGKRPRKRNKTASSTVDKPSDVCLICKSHKHITETCNRRGNTQVQIVADSSEQV